MRIGLLLLIALVLTLFFVRFNRHKETVLSKPQTVTQKRLGTIRALCYKFKDTTGIFPASAMDVVLVFPTTDSTILRDGWERSFIFSTNAWGCTVASLGADGTPGGIGENADAVLSLEAPSTKQ
jgi:hypothetical protein